MHFDILKYVGSPLTGNGVESVSHHNHLHGTLGTFGFRQAMRKMLEGWGEYAEAHRRRYGSPVGDDGALGEYWGDIGLNIKRLLDGETGGYDCGSLSSNITECIRLNGLETRDGYELSDPVRRVDVNVRSWWNKRNGHTVQSYSIDINSETVKEWAECDKGGAWLAADEWLTANGYINGEHDTLIGYCDSHGIAYHIGERKVSRKRDLFGV